MKTLLRNLLVAALFFLSPSLVHAATCFWVPLAVTGAVSGTGGLCRLTVNSTAGLLAGDAVIVAGILGSTACDGTTTVTTVVSTTLVEVNLSFNTLYTSGGTVAGGRWTTTSTGNWASATGGTVGTCAATGGVPKQAADTATFDGSSGGGIIFPDSTINGVTLTEIIASAFTGTLDFSISNPSLTLTANIGFQSNGTAVRTINLGSGTFTLTGTGTVWDFGTTASGNLTLNAGTSTIYLHGALSTTSTRQMNLNANQTYSTIRIDQTGTSASQTQLIAGTAVRIGTLTLGAPISVNFASTGIIYTITNAFTWAGTAFNNAIEILGSGTATVSAASGSTCNWCVLGGITFSNTAVNATNSFDLKGNNMNGGSITGPSGGGGHIIGG